MARGYPRFLLSDPKNTKSPGPFIIHTLSPRGMLKLDIKPGSRTVTILEMWEPCTPEDEDRLIKDATSWSIHL